MRSVAWLHKGEITMRMYVVRVNPDPRKCLPYSKYPTATEYKRIHKTSPMNGFHEAVNFLPEHGIIRGYLPPRHLVSMRTGEPFILVTITAKTAKTGGDKLVGVQAGCVYQGKTNRQSSEPGINLTWHYRCPASLSILFSEAILGARTIILGSSGSWVRGPTFEVKRNSQKRIINTISGLLRDSESKKRFKLLIERTNQVLPTAEFESESTFERDVAKAWHTSLSIVKGNKYPIQKEVRTFVYERDPKVVAYTLKNAKGICFDCKESGPFISKTTGFPYLEVHHVRTLKDAGGDTIDNTIALCPNCHRARHYS
ncbi:HNH endonuclease [Duganella violaceipulchra]